MTYNYRNHSGYPLCIQLKFVLNIWELGIFFDALCDIRIIVCCDNIRHCFVETMSNIS